MPGTLKAIALTKNRAPGAEGLLWNEPLGLAIDATTEGGTVYVRDTTPANNRYNEPLNGWLGSAGLLTNGGTSPKICQWNDGTLHWSAHNPSLHSQDFDNGYWTKSNSSISANATTAPDGTATADKLQVNTTNAFHYVTEAAQGSYTVQPGQIWTWSVYAKAAELHWLAFEYVSGTMDVIQLYDLSNGVLGTTTSGTLLNPTITSVGNGWYRCSIAGESTGTNIHINIFAQNGDNITTFAGANTTDGIYIWGGQANRGLSPTTYLVTTTAAVYGIPQQYDVVNNQFGILVEPAATNLLQRSQEFDNAYWIKSNVTVTANNTTAPDGSTTADKVQSTVTAAGTGTNNNGVTLTGGTTYTQSVYAKKGNQAIVFVALSDFTANAIEQWFNLDTASKLTSTTVGDGTLEASSITSVGNGWYRLTVTGHFTAGRSTNTDIRFPSADGTTSWTSGDNGYFWGAQLETGSFATTYIPTITGSVTRARDAISVTTSKFPWSNSGGAVYADVTDPGTTASSNVTTFDDNTGSAAQILIYQTGAVNELYLQNASVAQAQLDTTRGAAGVRVQLSGEFAANSFNWSTDGGELVIDTSGTMPSTILGMYVGADPGHAYYSKYSRIVYVPRQVDLRTWRYNF